MSAYGSVRPGLPSPVLDFIHLGASLSLRTHGCLGPALLAYGLSRPGFPMFTLDFIHLGLTMLLHGPA